MSYEMRFHCDLCEEKTEYVSHIASLTAGRMLIVGSNNLGTICDACADALVSSVEERRRMLMPMVRSAPRRAKKRVVL